MENSTEKNSSWVFVYADVNASENVSKAFHLDCSQEPIQELTEQDLSTKGSDTESDKDADSSDGISVISDSEISSEEHCSTYCNCMKIEDIDGNTHIVHKQIACTNHLCVDYEDDDDTLTKCFDTIRNIAIGLLICVTLTAAADYSFHRYAWLSKLKVDSVCEIRNDEIFNKTLLCVFANNHKNDYNKLKQCVKYGMISEESNEKFTDTTPVKHEKEDYDDEPENNKYIKRNPSGNWYCNMHQLRAELRKRNGKKNKAQWYFKRAEGRQAHHREKKYKAYSD